MRGLLLAVAMVGLTFGGCFADKEKDDGAMESPASSSGSGDSAPETSQAPDGLVEAPFWVAGQWWRWELTGYNVGSFEVTTVVAAAGPDEYRVGATDRDAGLRAQPFHVPALGVVTADALAWEAHDMAVRALEFPLHHGKRWSGEVEGAAVDFVATEEEFDGEAVFRVEGTWSEWGGVGPRFVYSPAAGNFLEFALHYGGETPFSSIRLLDHGLAYEGTAHVMLTNDKFVGGSGAAPNLAPPARFAVAGEKTFLVFGCYLGGDPGVYGITFATPNGEEPVECRVERTADGVTTQVVHRSSIEGEWTAVFAVGGSGFVEAEVLGVLWEPCSLGPADGDLRTCERADPLR